MRTPIPMAMILGVLIILISGCGGSGEQAAEGRLPLDAGGTDTVEIGPLVVHTSKTGNFQAMDIPSQYGCSFVALYGAQINYLASTAMLDRVAFSSRRSGTYNIYAVNLDGSGSSLVQLTNNGAIELWPRWSPDGTKIAFSRQWPSYQPVICTMNSDGTGAAALTSDVNNSRCPDWSPDGGRIAYACHTGGQWDVWRMYADGSRATNVTNDAQADGAPAWSPDGNIIAFNTFRYGGSYEIATIDVYGGPVSRLTNDVYHNETPAWDPAGSMRLAYVSQRQGHWEIFLMSSTGTGQSTFHSRSGDELTPRWSSDGQMIAFCSDRAGNNDIWIREVNCPYREWQVTKHTGDDLEPDLGSPTVQTERVLIGPAGSDRGGTDPLYPSAPAVIAAFDAGGYRNLVRIGVAAADLASLRVRPLGVNTTQGAMLPTGVEVSATKIANLRQDAGWGKPPTVWDFNALNAGMVLLYFNSETGKLVSAVAVRDSAYSVGVESGAGAPYGISAAGEGVKLSGAFSGVFDAEGNNLAPGGASSVRLGKSGEVLVVN